MRAASHHNDAIESKTLQCQRLQEQRQTFTCLTVRYKHGKGKFCLKGIADYHLFTLVPFRSDIYWLRLCEARMKCSDSLSCNENGWGFIQHHQSMIKYPNNWCIALYFMSSSTWISVFLSFLAELQLILCLSEEKTSGLSEFFSLNSIYVFCVWFGSRICFRLCAQERSAVLVLRGAVFNNLKWFPED